MGSKAKELDNKKNGDRGACILCNPPILEKKSQQVKSGLQHRNMVERVIETNPRVKE